MPSSPTSVQHHRGFQHNRQREKATGGEEQPPKPNLPSPGMRAKLVLWETHTHGELCVPRQPCPTPPMVLTGRGWESSQAAGKFRAARTQPGSGLVPAHQQHPKPPFQPPNQHRVAPLRAEPSPLPLPAPSASGSARRMEGKVLHWEWGTPPSDSLRPHPGPHSPKLAGASPGPERVQFPPVNETTPTMGTKLGVPKHPGWQGTVPQLTQPPTLSPRAWLQGASNGSGTPPIHQSQISPH